MILIVGCDDIWLRGPGLEEEFDEISVLKPMTASR
jgi:hypothetical protein